MENNGTHFRVMEGGVFPERFREELEANLLARTLPLSMEEETVLSFLETRGGTMESKCVALLLLAIIH